MKGIAPQKNLVGCNCSNCSLTIRKTCSPQEKGNKSLMLHFYPMVLFHLLSKQGVGLPQQLYAAPPTSTHGGLCGGTAAPLLPRSSGRVGMTWSRLRATSISPTQLILWAGYTSQQGNRLLLTGCMAGIVPKVVLGLVFTSQLSTQQAWAHYQL